MIVPRARVKYWAGRMVRAGGKASSAAAALRVGPDVVSKWIGQHYPDYPSPMQLLELAAWSGEWGWFLEAMREAGMRSDLVKIHTRNSMHAAVEAGKFDLDGREMLQSVGMDPDPELRAMGLLEDEQEGGADDPA